MREVKVKRAELLDVVRKNREKHIAEYEDAVLGYKEQAKAAVGRALEDLRQRIDKLAVGEVLHLSAVTFNLKVPENHASDYDQVIRMLEMSVDEVLTIRADEFACYVMDNWGWRDEWENTKLTYSSVRR